MDTIILVLIVYLSSLIALAFLIQRIYGSFKINKGTFFISLPFIVIALLYISVIFESKSVSNQPDPDGAMFEEISGIYNQAKFSANGSKFKPLKMNFMNDSTLLYKISINGVVTLFEETWYVKDQKTYICNPNDTIAYELYVNPKRLVSKKAILVLENFQNSNKIGKLQKTK